MFFLIWPLHTPTHFPQPKTQEIGRAMLPSNGTKSVNSGLWGVTLKDRMIVVTALHAGLTSVQDTEMKMHLFIFFLFLHILHSCISMMVIFNSNMNAAGIITA